MIVGISGKYCAGKELASLFFRKRGFYHIEVDKIGHSVLKEQRLLIASLFGKQVLSTDLQEINRNILGSIVFADQSKLTQLENILHPIMQKKIIYILDQQKNKNIIINAALLFSLKLDLYCQYILWVTAHPLIRMYRGKKRDKKSIRQIVNLMRRQKTLNPQPSSSNVDIYVVSTSLGKFLFEKKLKKIMRKYNKKYE